MAARPSPTDRLARGLFGLSVAVLMFAYGFCVGHLHWFPYDWLSQATRGAGDLQFLVASRQSPDKLAQEGILPWYFKNAEPRPQLPLTAGHERPLTLVTRLNARLTPEAALIDGGGSEVHRWELDWFRLWPEASHLPASSLPQSLPGTHIHGAVVLEDRKLAFNFEHLGLMCVDRDGKPLWRLPYATHHSLHLDEAGHLWVSGQKRWDKPDPAQPNRRVPFDEYTVLEVSQQGELLGEWSIDHILIENGYGGLLCLPGDDSNPQIANDVLHLNDVEPFPDHFQPGFFKPGDVMVSLRNINTVMVFDRSSRKIRHLLIGAFDGQHDPDFMDGDHYSVFDNNRSSQRTASPSSRIVVVDARDGSRRVCFQGTPQQPFFTRIAGKHQWLPDGHLLLTESCEGHVVELDETFQPVWSIRHFVGEGIVGFLEQADRLGSDGRSAQPVPTALPAPANP